MAITPDGSRAYITNFNGPAGTVSVIDTAINAVTATIPAGFGVVDVTADGTRVYVTQDIGAVSVINIATTR